MWKVAHVACCLPCLLSFISPINMSALKDLSHAAIEQSILDNEALLASTSPNTTICGKLTGKMGDEMALFSSSTFSAPVWKPSSTFSKARNNDGTNATDITRVCKLRIKCPSSILHRIWFVQHQLRSQWDTSSCQECVKKTSFVDRNHQPVNVFRFLSTPKPMISPREFVYAYKEIPYTGPGKGRLYAGSSIDLPSEHQADAVMAWLQGMLQIQEVNNSTCDVTYCIRVQPKGSLPKSVALLAASDLVLTLFSLRKRAEAMFVALKKKKKMKRKVAASKL